MLYAFCRCADDAVDVEGGRLDAIATLQDRLDRAYAGRPRPQPVDRALADVVHAFGIPRALPDALLEGLAWDAAGPDVENESDLHAYAARVAGAVGAMMAMLMGQRCPQVVSRAIDLGIAMQFTNIARDVGEDARAGRLYLPADWLRLRGIEPDLFLRAPAPGPALAAVIDRLLAAADRLYERADGAISRLPPACRPGIQVARLLYAEIGREVERNGLDPISKRAVVTPARKARLLPRAIGASFSRVELDAGAIAPEAQFLVEAVIRAPAPRLMPDSTTVPAGLLRTFSERGTWVIDLFDRLERRDQLGSSLEGALRRS